MSQWPSAEIRPFQLRLEVYTWLASGVVWLFRCKVTVTGDRSRPERILNSPLNCYSGLTWQRWVLSAPVIGQLFDSIQGQDGSAGKGLSLKMSLESWAWLLEPMGEPAPSTNLSSDLHSCPFQNKQLELFLTFQNYRITVPNTSAHIQRRNFSEGIKTRLAWNSVSASQVLRGVCTHHSRPADILFLATFSNF